MSIAYNSGGVTDGLVMLFDAANPRSRLGPNLIANPTLPSSYTANQNVTISQNGDYIQVVANQTTSTPGVWPIGGLITCTASTQYTFRVYGFTNSGSNAGIYAWGNVTGGIGPLTGSFSSTLGWMEYTFVTGASDTQIKVGVLWTTPTLGSTMMISTCGLHQTNKWYDLTENKNDATFNSPPAYVAANGGSYLFTGAQSALLTSPLASQALKTQMWTISGWVNLDTTANQMLANISTGLYPVYGSTNSLLYLNGGANDYYMYGAVIGGTGWAHVVFRFNNTTGYRTIYKNGVNISTGGPNNTSTPLAMNSTITLASGFRGNLAAVKGYNRQISDQEVIIDFNSARGRYGV